MTITVKMYPYLIKHPMNPAKPFIGVVMADSEAKALQSAMQLWGERSTFEPLTPDQVSEHSGRGVVVYLQEQQLS
jgi:hypothetical protein